MRARSQRKSLQLHQQRLAPLQAAQSLQEEQPRRLSCSSSLRRGSRPPLALQQLQQPLQLQLPASCLPARPRSRRLCLHASSLASSVQELAQELAQEQAQAQALPALAPAQQQQQQQQ
jgi:hypothetical protein